MGGDERMIMLDVFVGGTSFFGAEGDDCVTSFLVAAYFL